MKFRDASVARKTGIAGQCFMESLGAPVSDTTPMLEMSDDLVRKVTDYIGHKTIKISQLASHLGQRYSETRELLNSLLAQGVVREVGTDRFTLRESLVPTGSVKGLVSVWEGRKEKRVEALIEYLKDDSEAGFTVVRVLDENNNDITSEARLSISTRSILNEMVEHSRGRHNSLFD